MALLNRDLGAPETVFLTASPIHAHISSSLVKDVAGYGRDISALVPPAVHRALEERLAAEALRPDRGDARQYDRRSGAPGPVLPGTQLGRFVGADHTREDLP